MSLKYVVKNIILNKFFFLNIIVFGRKVSVIIINFYVFRKNKIDLPRLIHKICCNFVRFEDILTMKFIKYLLKKRVK